MKSWFFLYNFIMIYIYIFIPAYVIAILAIYIFITMKYSKKHPWWLKLIHSITLFFTLLLELSFIHLVRSKYKRVTPNVLKDLNKLRFEYHIVYGTFLFAYRDNNFADNDIDIAVFRKDYNSKIIKEMESKSFILKEEWYIGNKLMEQTYVNKKLNVSLDIFIIDSEFEGLVFDEKNNRYSKRETTFSYKTKKYIFEGITLNAPANATEYLKWIYGEWDKKDPGYHWLYGPSKSPSVIIKSKDIVYKKH